MTPRVEQTTFLINQRLWPSARWLALAPALLLLWIASDLAVPGSLQPLSRRLQTFVTIFLGIFIEAAPFLLAGVVVSSVIHLFLSPAQIQRLIPRSPVLASGMGALLGLGFPVCECGSVPTARRLMLKGAPVPLGIAFVLAAPAVNPIAIASTWIAFSGRLDMVLGRVALTAFVAMVVGIVLGVHSQPASLLAPLQQNGEQDAPGPSCGCSHEPHTHGRVPHLLTHVSSEFFEMGRYLVIGALIAATLQTFIPRAALLSLGQGPVISVLVLMMLAVVLSICSTVDAFVALAFVGSFLPGAILAFLVFGPMVDIKSVLMFGTTFRRRIVLAMTLLTFQMVLLAGVVVNLYV